MSTGSAVAVAGIWIGVGLSAFGGAGGAVAIVALCAMFATIVIAASE